MPTGHVYSYETRPESFTMAHNNLDDLGLLPYVTLYNEDITGGFHETDVDAVFLDLREPWLFLNHAWAAVKGSGFFGSLLPTVNQAELLAAGCRRCLSAISGWRRSWCGPGRPWPPGFAPRIA